jgi:hypothetical protein
MRQTLLALAVTSVVFGASAKLPPPDDAAKAKAAETAAKAAWQSKVDAYQLCKVQDKIAAKYGKHGGKDAKPVAAASAAAKPAASGASGATPTPAVASAPPPCADPGPFAYNPPEQKPLETSGAHSPAGTATSPPSVKQESGQIQASGKSGKK